MKPNLFDFATSELSQDAFLAWLLSWADADCKAEDPILHDCARDVIRLFISSRYEDMGDFSHVTLSRQVEHIDVLMKIDQEYVVVIEDKTTTSQHSGQLERYAQAIAQSDLRNLKPVYVYFKTGLESERTRSGIEEKGYTVICRDQLLAIFSKYSSNNAIYADYVAYLQSLEEEAEAFHSLPYPEWDWETWHGFYRFMDKCLMDKDWAYVSNPSGGFLGFWWHFQPWKDGVQAYLQLEQDVLCFKIALDDLNPDCDKAEYRNEMYQILMQQAEKEGRMEIHKPARFGYGTYMTVVVVDAKDWLGSEDKPVDLDAVVARLHDYEQFLTNCLTVTN